MANNCAIERRMKNLVVKKPNIKVLKTPLRDGEFGKK